MKPRSTNSIPQSPHDLNLFLRDFRRPFPPETVNFKIQSGDPQKPKALVVTYVDARAPISVLNHFARSEWSAEYELWDRALWCKLTICGVTRQDVGEGDSPKALVSDALKRAAVQFGIGISLYEVPKIFLDVQSPNVRIGARDNLYITDVGIEYLREKYSEWLVQDGIKRFGEPIDIHAETPPAVESVSALPPSEAIDTERAAELEAQLRAQSMGLRQIVHLFETAGVPLRTPTEEINTAAIEHALLNLTPDEHRHLQTFLTPTTA